jgi:hypothetical protein
LLRGSKCAIGFLTRFGLRGNISFTIRSASSPRPAHVLRHQPLVPAATPPGHEVQAATRGTNARCRLRRPPAWRGITQRSGGHVPAVAVEQVEHRVERRGDGVGVGLSQPLEPRAKLLVEEGELAVEYQRAGRRLPDGRSHASESGLVVASA